ncbi:MAG: SDR family NAD(P)-dependent oxidoreductase [Candidatus Puniceispirillales bacterium]|tara:strand:- start:498 stop:1325 length:828 start_codon:yes stop_codon:yes gene_type:complete
MSNRLNGKIAVITGGAKGLGRSIAEKFYEEGCKIIICDVLSSEAQKVAKNLKGKSFELDVSDSKQVLEIFNYINNLYNKIDILVNNAGINGFENRPDIIEERNRINKAQIREYSENKTIDTHFDVTVNMSDFDWFKMINTHLSGTFFCTREALKIMNKSNSGSIINMGSVLGTTGGPSSPHYSAAKGGILAYTRALARELASRNIRVNAIAPGYIDTDMTNSLGYVKDIVKSQTPMKKFGVVEDIAWAAVYLASDEAKFMTGQTISPNGGFVMSQ